MFVNSRTGHGRDDAILAAVIALAREMDIHGLAEGIETSEQLNAATQLGFETAQAYYIARPTEPTDVGTWLESGTSVHVAAATS